MIIEEKIRMDRLATPFLFIGPSGSGKLTTARAWIEAAHKTKFALPFEVRNFSVGDGYEAKVLASPYHFEIDIPNLSMQDKQIIGELLTTFFSSGDVFNSLRTHTRKLVILRRAHSLSQPAAIRVRAIIQQFVLPPDAAGMLWITAREMTGPLAILEDAFVKHRIPRMPYVAWSSLPLPPPLLTEAAWSACEGRKDRAQEILKFFPDGTIPSWPRRIQDFYDEMIAILIWIAASSCPPSLEVVLWIRGRIYQALSFCQTGPEIIDSCAAALSRKHTLVDSVTFLKAMHALTLIEPHTSYRTPLSLEAGVLTLFETLRENNIKSAPKYNEASEATSTAAPPKPADGSGVDNPAVISIVTTSPPTGAAADPAPVKKRRAAPRKRAGNGE
jgi:hypothetical protein